MPDIGYEELNALSGELLPGRTLLSIVLISYDNSSHPTYNFPAGGGHKGGGATVVYACQAESVHGTPGLLGSLGLGSNNPSSSMTCVPAAVTTH
ncbi:hypothetical protein [Actinacidiphila soli]|jgi:hypothetical protein|uniref:hypothetical protein n=1 Tax=Actinacidiphila soli TaxID=2487275 RepID=UPI000FC99B16|nr:hypothetical protein [Actinacidiphila soli]